MKVSMNVLHLEAIRQRYGKTPVLHDVNLTLAEGEVLGLFGHNGAGKTTIMKLILGLLQATEGRVQVFDEDPGHTRVRRDLGYLPENVTFYPQLTGRETLYHFARLKRAGCRQADALLAQVGLEAAADGRVKTYSKGMRQRLGLAQALIGSPRLLLLDEPTVGLDPIATQELYQLVGRLREQGTSIILCSHVLPGVEPYIDRAAILAQGRLLAIGTLAELRVEADLPIRIRAHGLHDREDRLQHWQQQGYVVNRLNAQGVELVTRSEHKLDLLRQLVNEANPGDIEIQQPSLEDLYCFYMERMTDNAQHAGRNEQGVLP